jgi:hypothetical protein
MVNWREGVAVLNSLKYLVDVSHLVEYYQNVVNILEVADDFVVLKDFVENSVFHVLKVQFRKNGGGGGTHG